jgi:uncharacterized protein YbaR (Trm112 family)
MKLTRVGDGAILGTLMLAQVEGGGYEISRKMSQLPSPVWMSRKGLVVGTHNGHLVHLTEPRLRMLTRARGAGLYRIRDGIPQILVSMGGEVLEANSDLQNLFKTGVLFFTPETLALVAEGGVTVGGEGVIVT